MYRVICNEASKHLQWIVVREGERGPLLVGGPYRDERVANMHCDALNQAERERRSKSRLYTMWERWFGAISLPVAGAQ